MQGSILGAAVKRAEDPRFVTGRGGYLPNRTVAGELWAVMVRSTVAHARLTGIDSTEASSMPGVVGVFTAADFDNALMGIAAPGATDVTRRPLLAVDKVRFVGDVVAVVVAETEAQAFDAAETVWPDFDILPAVADPAAALVADAPLLFDDLGSNVVLAGGIDVEGANDDAGGANDDVKVEISLVNQRVAAVPLEPNNALAVPRGDGEVDVWLGSQSVHGARNSIAGALGIDRALLHVKVPDMGGGFGAKISAYPEQVLVVALALKLDRPVRWQESRTENLVSMSHGRGQHQVVSLTARPDGTFVGLKWDVVQDAGAYPLFGAYLAAFTQRMAAGPYRFDTVDYRWRAVLTNTTPTDAYRGAGRPEAALTIERLVDLMAARLGVDPAELRRQNLRTPDEFPLTTPTAERYDTGDYPGALDLALRTAGYEDLRREQVLRRQNGHRWQLGIGLSCYVEVTAPAGRKDWGRVQVTEDEIVVYSGASSHGQGHETTFSQMAASTLGVELDRVRFVQGDTDSIVSGGGTMGSRSMQMAGSAVLRSSRSVLDKARAIVAHVNEAAIEDILLDDHGAIGVAGVPDTGKTIFEIAVLAEDPANVPEGMEPGLDLEDRWAQEHATVPFGSHVSVVEVDVETGDVRVLRHIACDDCGTIFNRMVVDGQVEGGVAQGLGQVLWESVRFDADANPLTSNLTTYSLPTAGVLPSFQVVHTQTPTDQNPLGAKGIGESGTIGSGPAVLNAIHDALRPYGVDHIDMPLTPARIWEAIS